MTKYNLSDQELEKIVDLARFAPSVHNTQPWLVESHAGGIKVSIDKKQELEAGDPVGRQTVISLGIFTEAICIAAADIGLSAGTVKFEHDNVEIGFVKTDKTQASRSGLIKKRATDRSVYAKIKLNDKAKEAIKKTPASKGTKVWLLEDQASITKLATLTSKGIKLALANPEFRTELSGYLLHPWSGKKRGISVKSLYLPWLVAAWQPELLKLGVNTGKEAQLEEKRWLSASAVILITTDGDLHTDWFEAGRTYLRVSLAVEDQGLSQATSAATIEASTFHEDVEKMLGTTQRLQAAIRIGKGSSKRRYSPRVSANELITSN